ncbi:hypothetical protein [[Eubacterium] cellulosolvens]|jgi:hypothetical protein
MKSGLTAGAIAGIIAGIVGVIWITGSIAIGLSQADPSAPSYWWVNQIVFNLIWGAIFGVIYQRFYDLVPSSGIMKGVSYAALLWLVHGVYTSVFLLAIVPMLSAFAVAWLIGGFIVRVIGYGIPIGFLYKK